MKMKLLFLLGFLFMPIIYIPTQGTVPPKERDAGQKQELEDINLRWGIKGTEGIILKKGYLTINYSEDWKIPYWVAYHISTGDLKGKVRRTNDFRPDPELPTGSRAELSDYKKSGYAKSHHATPEAFKYDKEAMSTTFLLSTISPQIYQLNRNLWPALDKEIIYKVAEIGEAWVFSGNLFLDSDDEITEPFEYIGSNRIAVPTHFFKVILFRDEKSHYSMEAYLIPNQRKISMNPADHLKAVDYIEIKTGYDFFHKIDNETEDHLESITPHKMRK